MEYFDGVVRRVLEEIENTEYDDAFADVPKPEVEGEEITPERKHIRSLREEPFQFISFDCDDSVKFERDYLFQILNSAGLDNIFLNEACENMKTKPWFLTTSWMQAISGTNSGSSTTVRGSNESSVCSDEQTASCSLRPLNTSISTTQTKSPSTAQTELVWRSGCE